VTARPFIVEHIKRRSPAPPKPVDKPAAMDLAELLERVTWLKDKARTLRGVGRGSPEAFTEDKDELHRAVCRLEDDLRRRGVVR
jgi:hypothetical protein